MHGKDNIGFLFDLDGVIIDSERRYTEIWSEINVHFPTGVEGFERKIKGTTLSNILSTYFHESDWKAIVRMLDEKEQSMVYDYCPGASELLDKIGSAGLRAALVTSSNEKKLAHLHKELPGVLSRFDVVVDSGMVCRSKPDPEGYLKGARLIGVSPSRCAVFEDSVQGVKAGQAAGAFVVGVAGTMDVSDLYPYSDIIVNSLEEVDFNRICAILESRSI